VLEQIAWEQTAAGVIVPVQAQPGARRNGIAGVHAGRLKVAVTQVAERGKANAALCAALADALDVKRSQVTLLSGETNPQKRFFITGVTIADVAARVEAALQE
jgi:uncharacterized protein (TIGR00251 family)